MIFCFCNYTNYLLDTFLHEINQSGKKNVSLYPVNRDIKINKVVDDIQVRKSITSIEGHENM